MRRGELIDMRPSGGAKTRMTFHVPSRGLIGYHGQFLTDTRGTGIMSRLFHAYSPYKGTIEGRRNGVLISNGAGNAVAYGLWYLQDRGPMFIQPGTQVYAGMIIGEHSRGNDLEVNPLRSKQLTNIRTTSKDEAVRLTPPRQMTLEVGDRLCPGRRGGGGDAQEHPAAQGDARPQRPQARRSRGGGRGRDAS